MTITRTSPVMVALDAAAATWCELNAMAAPLSFGKASVDPGLADLSALQRCGLKGPGAAAWLAGQGLPVPERPNSWAPWGPGLVVRLGRGEFLVESGLDDTRAIDIARALGTGAPGVYPVLRQDCALLLRGARTGELLLQTCNVNLSDIPAQNREATLTSMVGVSVTILKQPLDGYGPCYRIWCDGTFGAYLWETLLDIASDLGGGAIGLADVFAQANALPRIALKQNQP